MGEAYETLPEAFDKFNRGFEQAAASAGTRLHML